MAVKVTVVHDGDAYAELFKSFQPAVDAAGERIAAEANAGFDKPHYNYSASPGPFYARGYVRADAHTGAYYEATEKRLTRAVHA